MKPCVNLEAGNSLPLSSFPQIFSIFVSLLLPLHLVETQKHEWAFVMKQCHKKGVNYFLIPWHRKWIFLCQIAIEPMNQFLCCLDTCLTSQTQHEFYLLLVYVSQDENIQVLVSIEASTHWRSINSYRLSVLLNC